MSDSNMPGSNRLVVGTAGHIDHGKTALVRALTGIETDRLKEEKRRGISIDLGFAHLTLPTGERISFIDVPGHERFIKNMLAGVGGIEAVLLVIASDESVKPQTREHFDICRLLSIERGLIVLTKADLVTTGKLAETEQDVRRLCQGSFLEHAAVIAVSALNGNGLPELKRHLAALARATTKRATEALPRLPVDRSFALKGFGTIVTGTLWAGKLSVGDTVEIFPQKLQARIRGLQVRGEAVNVAYAGERTAVNLAGVQHTDLSRGSVLTLPQTLESHSTVDVAVEWLDPSYIPARRQQVFFHIGTAEIVATVKVFEAPFARLELSHPIVVLPGDRFVLRLPSPARTVAGGHIVDACPPRRISRAKTAARLKKLNGADLPPRLEILVGEAPTGRKLKNLVSMTGVPAAQIKSTVEKTSTLWLLPAAEHVVTREWITHRRQRVLDWLKAFHNSNPNAAGAPLSQARLGLEPALAQAVLSGFEAIRIQGETIALATHRAQFSAQELEVLSKIENAFRSSGYQPPAPGTVLTSTGADLTKSRSLLEALVKGQRLVRISEDLIFHAEVVAHIRTSLAAHKGRRFSVPDFKSWTNISRKYAIPLLEYLDRQRVTRRDGDARIVL